jgi:hypothetical protein
MKLGDTDFTLCTSVKNRNENLEKVIPIWKELPFSHCIIVDWNSDYPVWDAVGHLMDDRFSVVRFEYFPHYWSSIIHNISMRMASTEWILRTDADIFFLHHKLLESEFDPSAFYVGGRPENGRGTEGTVLCKKAWYTVTGGYDERQTGYGWEDVHFYWRMERLADVEQRYFPKHSLVHIAHDDEVRTEYRDIASIESSSEAQGMLDWRDWSAASEKFRAEVYKVHGKKII